MLVIELLSDMMKSLKVELHHLNDVRKIIAEKELMNMNYKIKTDKNYGYIPIKEIATPTLIEEIKNTLQLPELNITNCETELVATKHYPKSITEALKGKLNPTEIEELKKSFDTIGNIVILEIPEELEKYKKTIGEATLNFTKRTSVYMKKSPIEGVTRTRQLELIAGENNPVTIHKEHGTRLKLDVTNVYFSPRLATERKRVSDNVKEDEKILDMFCGIGPFPIVIAHNKKCQITAVDINNYAIKYLKENIKLNKLKGSINPICGDIIEVSKNDLTNQKFDRIIMNLPGLAYQFLDLAIKHVENEGIINYYEFSDNFGQGIERIQKAAHKQNKNVEILKNRKVKSSSPGMWHVGIDAKITEKE